MDADSRKKLVAELLSSAGQAAKNEAEIIKCEAHPTREFLYEHLRKYVLAKFLLPPDCEATDIRGLAALSLERTMKLDSKIIRSLDQATPCNNATSESTKKVLLLYAVQTDLGLKPDPEKIAKVSDLNELADYVYGQLPDSGGCPHTAEII